MKEYDGDKDWVSNGVGGQGGDFFSLFFSRMFFSHIFQSVYVPSQNCISDQKSHTSTPLTIGVDINDFLCFSSIFLKPCMIFLPI